MHNTTTTIAQLLCPGGLALDFARLVGDIDGLLARADAPDHRVIWDCDEIASFEMAGTRIVLTVSGFDNGGVGGTLSVSVGPSGGMPACFSPRISHEALCSRLVEVMHARVQPRAILWQQLDGALCEARAFDLQNTPVILTDLDLAQCATPQFATPRAPRLSRALAHLSLERA